MEVWHGAMPGGGHILTAQDITRRNEAEIIARQANKMESLGRLTGGVAHDFNNLLQVVSVNLELMSHGMPDRTDLRQRLAEAVSAVERGAKLTGQLLGFARRQPLQTQALDTPALLRNFEDLLRRTFGPSIEVEMRMQPDLWPLLGEATQFDSALLNLAINARDAMPGGGRLTIEAINGRFDRQIPGGPRPGEYVIISVIDTGTGMSPELLARAVEPFYTTKPEGKGTGLGLSMVYGFVNQVGGAFRIASEPGQGTTVQLTFPRATQAIKPQQPSQATPPAKGEMILAVEDNNAVRTSVVQTLLALGYQVREAANGVEALLMLDQGFRPDLLFSDVVMDGAIDGIALARAALQRYPGLPVLLTSGYTENPDTQHRIAEMGVGLIGKPWRIGDLAQRLRQLLGDRPSRFSQPPPPQRQSPAAPLAPPVARQIPVVPSLAPAPTPNPAPPPPASPPVQPFSPSMAMFSSLARPSHPVSMPERIEPVRETVRETTREPVRETGAPAPVPASAATRPHILLVDDDPSLLSAMAESLVHLGYEVSVANSGTTALQAAARRGVDVLITDWHLPDLDGMNLAQRLREHHRDLPVIIATGDNPGAALPSMVWLQKPFTLASLRGAISSAVGEMVGGERVG